ncbi:GDSL esterase/lipase [Nymphaea thermarum]|nr:GDSL esterase/lipase [Nymphaea thermarum]
MKISSAIFRILLLFLILLCSSVSCLPRNQGSNVTAMFVFGSSLVDNGNNNYVRNSTARADYLPYGIDFPCGPSGRFSNGNNPVDVLGRLLNLPHLLPVFSDPKTRGKRILRGVNYASGGSGILDETGSISGGVITLKQQIDNFEGATLPELKAQLGRFKRAGPFISKSLFVVGAGGNDYLLNYFQSNTSAQYSLPDFTSLLIQSFSEKLKRLYDLGARKFVLLSVQALGCVPAVTMRVNTDGSCVEPVNLAALLFNQRLVSSMDKMKASMRGSHLVFVNSYNILKEIIEHPTLHGFKEVNKACCELGESSARILCKRGGETCKERDAYVFYDGLHPTDAVNVRIAKKAYASRLKREVYPFNIQHLASL